MTPVHAFFDDALGDHDAVGLVAELRTGRVGVREVVDAAIARVEQLEPELHGLAFAAFDRARVEARMPRPGFFSGVPTFVKDNADVAGMPTAAGTDAFTPRVAAADGEFTRMYLATGLLPLGKSQLSEYGFSASAEHPRLGAVHCPWDTARSSGASSSGSAVFVAAGAVPIAHANDGGGSIRIPAAVNGLVGLKPTRDRLAQDAVLRRLPVRIISDGVLTRSVRDTAAFFREAEKVYRNVKLAPIGDLTRPGRKRLRVGVITETHGRGATPEVRDLTLATASLLEDLGHRVEEAESPLPESFPADFVLYWSMLAMVVMRTGRREHGGSWDPDRLDNLTRGLASHCEHHLHRLPTAIARLARSRTRSARFFESYDVLLTPTLATETPLLGHLDPRQEYAEIMHRLEEWVAFTPVQNATGDPAISLPLATTATGLPQGMMFGGPAGSEAVLLALAYELEQARPFARIQDRSVAR